MTNCEFVYTLTIRGVILDSQTSEPIADTPVGARTIIDGQIVGRERAVDEHGLPVGVPSDANGAFAVVISQFMKPARPDRVQLIIIRDGCEQRFMIEINDDTARFVEEESSVSVLELTAPILVPPCEQFP